MPSGHVDDVPLVRVDVLRLRGRLQQLLVLLLSPPFLRRRVQHRELHRTWLQRHLAAFRTDELLLVALRGEDFVGVRELREPEAGRVARILVVGDVGDDVKDTLLLASVLGSLGGGHDVKVLGDFSVVRLVGRMDGGSNSQKRSRVATYRHRGTKL